MSFIKMDKRHPIMWRIRLPVGTLPTNQENSAWPSFREYAQ